MGMRTGRTQTQVVLRVVHDCVVQAVLATAHAAKFSETVSKCTGIDEAAVIAMADAETAVTLALLPMLPTNALRWRKSDTTAMTEAEGGSGGWQVTWTSALKGLVEDISHRRAME